MHAKVGDYLVVKGKPRNGMINMLRSSRCAPQTARRHTWCVGW